MKAILNKENTSIELENGSVYHAKPNESQIDFINRIKEEVKADFKTDLSLENLLKGKKVIIDNFLTTDPFNKRGEVGTITKITEIDEESADVTIEFQDGIIGLYQFGTFEIV